MSIVIIILALLIALPVRAYEAGRATAANGCVTTWRGSSSTTRCPNGDWSRRDWGATNRMLARGWAGYQRPWRRPWLRR